MQTRAINWDDYSKDKKISKSDIIKYNKYVNWDHISRYQSLSTPIMREFLTRLNWDYISQYQVLTTMMLREFSFKLNWKLVSQYQTLSALTAREFQYLVDWEIIVRHQVLTIQLMNEIIKHLDWDYLLCHVTLPEDMLVYYHDRDYNINIWKLISQYQALSEIFINKYESKLIWNSISKNEKILTYQFIQKYRDKIVITKEVNHVFTLHRMCVLMFSKNEYLSEDLIDLVFEFV